MQFQIKLGQWNQLATDASRLRYEVFVIEQHVPIELELDEFDPLSIHALAFDASNAAIGTGRLLPDGHIGRMAVIKEMRGKGAGGALLRALMDEARRRGDACVVLSAQLQAMPFYERFGFVAEGDEFMDAGIPHKRMRHVFTG